MKTIMRLMGVIILFATISGCGDVVDEMREQQKESYGYANLCRVTFKFSKHQDSHDRLYYWDKAYIWNANNKDAYLEVTTVSGSRQLHRWINNNTEDIYNVKMRRGTEVFIEATIEDEWGHIECQESTTRYLD